jgi:hypothetical protein
MIGLSSPVTPALVDRLQAGLWITGGLLIVWILPNTQQIFRLPYVPRVRDVPLATFQPEPQGRLAHMLVWRPTLASAIAFGFIAAASISLLYRTKPFIYFQF